MAKSKVLKIVRDNVKTKLDGFNKVISYKGIDIPEKTKDEVLSDLMLKFELVLNK
jgi:hypothetical protein